MAGKHTREEELNRSKLRARLLAAQLDVILKRDRQVGALMLDRLRRRRPRLGSISMGVLAFLLLRRALSGRR